MKILVVDDNESIRKMIEKFLTIKGYDCTTSSDGVNALELMKNEKFDVVFLDPPFQKKILIAACNLLESRSLLNQGAQIYLEYEKNSVDLNQLPQNWIIKKQGKTSTIDYILCEKK